MNSSSHNRRGIAIISVLIVIALISASVSLMLQRFGRDLKQTQFIVTQTQSLNHLYSLEAWAKSILLSDDLSVNVNNLIDLETNIYSPQYRSFFYDCINLINTQLQQQLMADTIFSYVVSQSPKPKLFEQSAEIRKIKSISIEDYIKIKPHLTALPSLTPINVNTASKEVLSCIHPQLSGPLVNKVIQNRKNKAFGIIDEFWTFTHTLLPNLTLDEIKENFPVKFVNTVSDYFLLETRIVLEKNKLIGRTILYRKDGKITIMSRSYHQPL